MVLFVLVILIFIWVSCVGIKCTKVEFLDYYKVKKRVFNKWMEYLLPKKQFILFKGKRVFDIFDILYLLIKFGEPIEEPYSKGILLEVLQMSYKDLKDNIALNFERLHLTVEAYSKMNIFPPKQGQLIIEHLRLD